MRLVSEVCVLPNQVASSSALRHPTLSISKEHDTHTDNNTAPAEILRGSFSADCEAWKQEDRKCGLRAHTNSEWLRCPCRSGQVRFASARRDSGRSWSAIQSSICPVSLLSGVSSTSAILHNRLTVGLRIPRSKRLIYVRSKPQSALRRSCEWPACLRSSRTTIPTAFAFRSVGWICLCRRCMGKSDGGSVEAY